MSGPAEPRPVLTDAVRESLSRSVLCWLASADLDGRPNVSPKEVVAALDDTRIAVANIASPHSVRNLRKNPRVCVSFVDVFVQKGFKLVGTATIVGPSDPGFEQVARPLLEMVAGQFSLVSAIVIEVTSVVEILAPSYRFIDGTTESSQVESAMARYGVRPRASEAPG